MSKSCPACGFNSDITNYKYAITNLLNERPDHISRLLKNTINKIIKYIPSERDNKKVYYFLQAISKLEDTKVKYGIEQYLHNKYYMQQKGYSYLKVILINVGANSEMKKRVEKKIYGTLPKEQTL